MVNTTQTNIYKVTLLLLLAFCLGGAGKLYATQNDEVDEKKEDMPDTAQDSSPNDADNQAGGGGAIEWNDKHQVDWECKSIQSCKAVITIMGCLEYWQKITNDIGQLGQVFQYLSASNNYRDIVGAYHHVLDKHLNGKNNKEAFRFINGRVQQHISCNFAKCKGYDRNQRDRGNEIAEKDEVEQHGDELIFIRDTLDTIHAYLVHGSDSGHRYSPSNYTLHKVHKRPKDDSDDKKETDEATTYTLFDEEMAALRGWQKSIQKKGRNQTKNKFSTDVALLKKNDDKVSFDLLAAHFKNNPTFALWLQYLRTNACDTDVLLNNIHDGVLEDNILSSGFKGDKNIVAEAAHFIHQRANTKQEAEKNKKTASYGFGVRLYYWDYYKNKKYKDKQQPQYRVCDLYVAPFYPSFKNELLAKKNISVSTWNKKMYAAKLMLAQSATLKRLNADGNRWYGIQTDAGLSIWHLLSIIFYTNFTALCTAFGESLRYLSPSGSLKELVQRNSKWYYLSKYLREVVECFGTAISGFGYAKKGQWYWNNVDSIKGDTYYHGVSYLLFTQFSVHWYGPLSTSKQMEVATLFTTSTDNGLLLELKKNNGFLRFFNVSLLSCFGSEDERLFIGGRKPIQIVTIRLLKDNINLQQIMHALFIVQLMISGKEPGNGEKALPTDAAIYKDLCAPPTQVPRYAQQIWNAFRHQQQRITIDIEHMYAYYKAFMPQLFDPKYKKLLLFDKIAKLFPNVTEIICKNTDCIRSEYRWDERNKDYSDAIVCSKFILGVKERLSKLDKHAKLTKIVIQTKKYQIKDHCSLYPTQFGVLGWQIGSGNDTIVITKEPYKVRCKEVIAKIRSMVRAERPSYEAPSLDVPIFKQLILGGKDLPADVQKQWYTFRHEQQSITIDMKDMYRYYSPFMPLLFDSKLQHLLLLDKIVQIFPKVTEIICKNTDYVDKDAKEYIPDKYGASFTIVCSHFILGVKERLSKLDKHAKLTKIVIQTDSFIKDSCKLYATEFGALGWQIGKGCTGRTIVMTKQAYDVMYKDVIPKISAMIEGKEPSDDIPPSLDVPIFTKLIAREKDIPADVQKEWDAFRHQQQCITIDIKNMYGYFQACMPLLFDPKVKNLLLLDKIAQLFPNITEIICKNTDYVGKDAKDYKPDQYGYSAGIACSNFILGVKERLSKLDKHAKLTKIVIKKTSWHEITDDCKLYPTQFGALAWQIGRGGKTIVLTKEPYNVMCKDVIDKIESMIKGRFASYEATSLDVPIFNKLIVGAKDMPADVQKQWDAFRHNQQHITIDMKEMYGYFQAFIPLLFDPKLQHLLLLDKIMQLFPNVTEIICKETDRVSAKYDDYSAGIVCSNFILGVKERLSKMDKHAKLTKIVIQTYKHEIEDDCNLYPTQFWALEWQVQRGSWVETYSWRYKTERKNCQITLTKVPHNNIWEAIIKEGVIPHISFLIAGKSSYDSKLTSASCIAIFNRLTVGAKDIPADVQKQWDVFSHQQQRISINMEYMYKYYKAFIPLLCDPKVKNLLLLDKIVQLFPNVTEIICQQTDCIKYNSYHDNDYSSAIVSSNFILGVRNRLTKIDKHAKLTKIIIKTKQKSIQDECNLYPPQFGALGWKIGKGCDGFTIVLTKEAYDVMYKDVTPKILAMVTGKEPSVDIPPAPDVLIFNQLIVGAKDIPADAKKQWNELRYQQQRITIHIYYMYHDYKSFIPLLFDAKIKNLLLLDKVVNIFPNVTEIICKSIDCINEHQEPNTSYVGTCSSSVVSPNFILGVKERLSKIHKHTKLKKIIIKTFKYEIDINLDLYVTSFGALGWKLQKEAYDGCLTKKNNQITLTRLKEPNASLPNKFPALSRANGNKPNDHQATDNAVFDLD